MLLVFFGKGKLLVFEKGNFSRHQKGRPRIIQKREKAEL